MRVLGILCKIYHAPRNGKQSELCSASVISLKRDYYSGTEAFKTLLPNSAFTIVCKFHRSLSGTRKPSLFNCQLHIICFALLFSHIAFMTPSWCRNVYVSKGWWSWCLPCFRSVECESIELPVAKYMKYSLCHFDVLNHKCSCSNALRKCQVWTIWKN